MVTLPSAERLPLLMRSIDCYARQTYETRELVVALDTADAESTAAVCDCVASLRRADIRVLPYAGTTSLGALRNLALRSARGDLVAVWDDDDICHPHRLEVQVRELRENDSIAAFLCEVLHLFAPSHELYWTNYKNTVQHCLPGTGVWVRDAASRYPESGPDSARGEDTALCLRLMAEGRVRLIDEAAHLYIYVSHGRNTSGDAHHRMLARSLAVSRARVLRREAHIRAALDLSGIELDSIDVHGANGWAFAWRPPVPR